MILGLNQPAWSCIRSEVDGELIDFIADNQVFLESGL